MTLLARMQVDGRQSMSKAVNWLRLGSGSGRGGLERRDGEAAGTRGTTVVAPALRRQKDFGNEIQAIY